MKKIKIGIVGAGFNGQISFIQNFYKNKKCEILGLAEARDKLRIKVGKKFKIKKLYKNHLEMIKDIKYFDGIAIITRREMIGPISYEFLKHGKIILSEKPIAGNSIQSKKLLKISARFKSLHKVGYNKIYDEGVEIAKKYFKKIMQQNLMGKLVHIRSHRLSGSGYDKKNKYILSKENNFLRNPSWPKTPKWLPKKFHKSYEKYLNLYCHNLSILRYFMNEQPRVEYAHLSDNLISIVRLKYKKHFASLETGFFTKKGWDEKLEFYFQEGSMKIFFPPQHFKNKSASFVIENRKNGKNIIFKSKKSWSFKNQCDAFLIDIKNRKIKINNAIDAHKDLMLVEEIWRKGI